MFIEEYFAQIEAWIAPSPYVLSWNLLKDKRSQTIGYLRGQIEFRDGSQLHVMEFVDTQHTVERYKYAYHYQDREGNLVFRYDMAPHHPEVPFPITNISGPSQKLSLNLQSPRLRTYFAKSKPQCLSLPRSKKKPVIRIVDGGLCSC